MKSTPVLVALVLLALASGTTTATADLPATCPFEVGRWHHGPSFAVSASGSLGVYGSGAVLVTVDLSSPTQPLVLGEITLPDVVYGAEMNERYAFVAAGEADLRVIDLVDPANPEEVASVPYGSSDWHHAKDVVLAGELLFVLGAAGVTIYDVSEPTLPTPHGTYPYDGYTEPRDLSVNGNVFAVIFADVTSSTVFFVDFTNPDVPDEVGMYHLVDGGGQHYHPLGLLWLGDTLYVSEYNQMLWIVDASDPTNPLSDWVMSPGGLEEMAVVGNTLVGQYRLGSIGLYDISTPNRPTFLTWVEGIATSDLWPRSSSIVASSFGGGINLVDLTTPSSPSIVSKIDGIGAVRDLAVTGSTGFMMSESWSQSEVDSGFVTFEVSPSPSMTLLDRVDDRLSEAIDVSENSAYVSAFDDFLVLDISDPSDLAVAGSSPDSWKLDIAIRGTVAASPLYVYDLAVPSIPSAAASCDVGTGSQRRVELAFDHAYHTRGSSSLELVACDVSNPAVPTTASITSLAAQPSDLLLVRDHLVMTTPSGIQTFDLSDPANPTHDGFLPVAGDPERIAVLANLLFVTDTSGDGSVLVVDAADLSNPSLACSIATAALPSAIAVSGGRIYVGFESTGIQVFDLPGVVFADDFERGDTRHWN
ncbi:MAG: hypothetical protein V2I67_10255 [Thermoanaerobaculales bacterium]|jgi:hypothetical protein|nr:hypothetical protein [Thermoanaerobaculales bacterium]